MCDKAAYRDPSYRQSTIRKMQRDGEVIEVDILWDTDESILEKAEAGWRFVRNAEGGMLK